LEVKNKMMTSSVSTRGQLVIPYKLRKKYGIKPHSIVRWMDTGQGLMLIPLTDDPVTSSRGMLKGTKVSTRSLLEAKKEDKVLEERGMGAKE
jgi:bifunctional DNA-binding transcriptional regulator/antitoxin component of YhaV-PrlF toxin-antitoxin module